MTERMKKLLHAAEIILPQDDCDVDLAKLVAASMQTGYELGKLSAEQNNK